MKQRTTQDIFNKLFSDYPALNRCKQDILNAFNTLVGCYQSGGKVMVCGNGGSAADSEHIVGELMKGFMLKRPVTLAQADALRALGKDADFYISKLQQALPCISLVSQSAILTAFQNDVDADLNFAQLVFGYAKAGDVLIGLSTSGNSKNVVHAVKVGKAFGVKSIAFTGELGGILAEIADVAIKAPASETYKVQEYHLPIYHALCAMVESEFFDI